MGNKEGWHLVVLFITAYTALLLNYYITIAIHEAGHLVTGLLTRYRFLLFRIGSRALVRTKDGLTIRRALKPEGSGQCLMLPTENSMHPKYMFLGGVLFNLCYAALLIWLAFAHGGMIKALCFLFAGINIFTAIFNMIPFKNSLIENDGKSIRDIRTIQDVRYYVAQVKIAQNLINGIPFREMAEELFFIEPNEITLPYLELCLYRYYRLLDMGKLTEAGLVLDEMNKNQLKLSKWLLVELEKEKEFMDVVLLKNEEEKRNKFIYSKDKRKKGKFLGPNELRFCYGMEKEILLDEYGKFDDYVFQGEVESCKNMVALYILSG